MFKPKQNQQSEDFNESELNNLRETVLRWVDIKDQETQKKSFINKKKKDAKPQIKPSDTTDLKKINLTPIGNKKKSELLKQNNKPLTKGTAKNSGTKAIKYKQPRRKKNPIGKIIIGLITLLLLGIIGIGSYLYIIKPTDVKARTITKAIPYPIGIVNWQPIYYYHWANQVASLHKFYDFEKNQNPDLKIPTNKEIEKHILDILIEKELIDQLAKKYGLAVSNQEVNAQLENLITEIGGEAAFKTEVKNLYSWDIAQFKKEILEPLLLKNKVSMAVTIDDRLNQTARQQAQNVLERIKKGEEKFEDIAFQESQDPTSVQGGDLGYFGKGQLVPDFEEAAFNLEEGEVSEIVKTQFGYHIIKLEEKLLDDNEEVSQIRARHILIRGKTLSTLLEEMKNDKIILNFVNL